MYLPFISVLQRSCDVSSVKDCTLESYAGILYQQPNMLPFGDQVRSFDGSCLMWIFSVAFKVASWDFRLKIQ